MAKTVYYKATRPDGTDFMTGTVRYVVGERTEHPSSRKKTKDDPSTYLSVATVPTDCVGMRWPCRLFEVHGVGRPMRSEYHSNKRAFLAVDVVAELPAYEVFGPQGEAVAALIERASRLTSSEADELRRAWDASRDVAWYAAGAAALSAARDAAWDAAWYAAGDVARDVAWDAAWDAAWYAAGALVVRDLICEHHFETLYGPWRSVVGE